MVNQPLTMATDFIASFSVSYNRHQGCWSWRERKPSPYASEQGHKIRGDGYRLKGQALAAIRQELQRRQQGMTQEVTQ